MLVLLVIGSVVMAQAQTFTILHSFTLQTNFPYGWNGDGAAPLAALITSGNTLYGTAEGGGTAGLGTVFAIQPRDGLRVLHNFTGQATTHDGSGPQARLILTGNTLYGTTAGGGDWGKGTVFKVNTDGTDFKTLHSFTAPPIIPGTNGDGAVPLNGLVLSSNTLYGTTYAGGSWGNGTLFAVNIDGSGFTTLHNFIRESSSGNSGGDLLLWGNILYGTMPNGGLWTNGTIFAMNTDGTGFTNLYVFTQLNQNTNSDGAYPDAALISYSGTLYGTTAGGGSGGSGTVFALNRDGTGFRTLHSFTPLLPSFTTPSGQSCCPTNSDGDYPVGALVLSGNTLYGTTDNGGVWGGGTVFMVNIDGTGFTTLYSFGNSPTDAVVPFAGLVLMQNTLYGTTFDGGTFGSGTVFGVSFTPQLKIIASGGKALMTWPTDYAGFDYSGYALQSTANLASPAWTTINLPAAVVLNGQYTVTNPISDAQQFFRLSQ